MNWSHYIQRQVWANAVLADPGYHVRYIAAFAGLTVDAPSHALARQHVLHLIDHYKTRNARARQRLRQTHFM